MRTRRPRGILLAALLGALLAAGCGGAGGGTTQVKATARLGLSLRTETTGATESVVLHASGAEELHQLSCRITYNPRALRFVDASRGDLVDSRALFFTTTKGAGYVPVAFTYHAGEKIPAGSGDVVTLRFEVLDPSADTALCIIDDQDLLLARDALRRGVPVTVQGAGR